ncbi:acyltransferase family protein [Hymenobacter canadensis]|uniref:Acyltransferase n=1 Tax=Hymenobacter canadensis TaxID=2999067 RepID=A0ABY7LQU6_9BACT|nr:acyltransferase [Hymenobacter canadensis]WBA41979.1 acyltransferase [Hymenobacter canadensis]
MSERNYTIDAFRLLGALSVVALHVPYGDMNNSLVLGIRMWGRWAVPFFFLLSGYFFEQNYAKIGDMQFAKTIRNLLSIFIVANAIYIVSYFFTGEKNIYNLADFHNLDNGVAGHLWFIGSMVFAYVVFVYVLKKIDVKYYILIALILYSGLLYCDAYSKLFYVKADHDLVRYIISVPFILAGYYVSKFSVLEKYSNKYLYFALVFLGLLIQAAEFIGLYKLSGYGPHGQEFVFGSAIFAFGMFGLAFSIKNDVDNVFSSLGRKYSLLIYLYHPLVNVFLFAFWKPRELGGRFLYITNPVISFLLCVSLFVLLDKVAPKVVKVLNGG